MDHVPELHSGTEESQWFKVGHAFRSGEFPGGLYGSMGDRMSVSKEFFLAVLVLSLVGLVFFGWLYFVGELVLTSLLIRTAPVVKQGIRIMFSLAAGTLLLFIFLNLHERAHEELENQEEREETLREI